IWQVALMLQLAGKPTESLALAERVLTIAHEQSFAFWLALPTSSKGAALYQMGRYEEAVALLREGIQRSEATGAGVVHPHFLGCLAEALWAVGRRDEAWGVLNRALSMTERDLERSAQAELYRRRAAFLLDEAPANAELAAVSLETAMRVAHGQGGKF